ncbi:hypothetical protein ABK040_000607 [Willaertia magna]
MLDSFQQAAIRSSPDKPLMIISGPGSGKTTTIIGRIGRLINDGINPNNILLLTFSKRACDEVQERVRNQIVLEKNQFITIRTFHAFCLYLIHKSSSNTKYTIISKKEQRNILQLAIDKYNEIQNGKEAVNEFADELEVNPQQINPSEKLTKEQLAKISQWISKQKSRGKTPGDFKGSAFGHCFAFYNEELKNRNSIDFCDMLMKGINILDSEPKILDHVTSLFRYVLVDEFQDLNYVQYLLLKKITLHSKKVTIVLDDDQSIYGFRGGDPYLRNKFTEEFGPCEERELSQNYRSVKRIVNISSTMIGNNKKRKDKRLFSNREMGNKAVIAGFLACDEEEKFIVESIKDLRRKGTKLRDIAVLSRLRKNVLSRFEKVLKDNSIPFIKSKKKSITGRFHLSPLISFLSLASNEYDNESFKKVHNIPKRRLGDTAIVYIEKVQNDLKSSTDAQSYLKLTKKLLNSKFPASKDGTKLRADQKKGFEEFCTFMDKLTKYVENNDLISSINYVKNYYKEYGEKLSKQEVHKAIAIERTKEWKKKQNKNNKEKDDEEEYLEPEELELSKEADKLIKRAKNYLDSNVTYSLSNVQIMRQFVESLKSEEHGADIEQEKGEVDAVTVTTIHQSKGLEWKHVFIVAANEGVSPVYYKKPNPELDGEIISREDHIEEERRLLYVAITRAKDTVTLSFSQETGKPSTFLMEIPPAEVDCIGTSPLKYEKNNRQYTSKTSNVGSSTNQVVNPNNRLNNTVNPPQVFKRPITTSNSVNSGTPTTVAPQKFVKPTPPLKSNALSPNPKFIPPRKLDSVTTANTKENTTNTSTNSSLNSPKTTFVKPQYNLPSNSGHQPKTQPMSSFHNSPILGIPKSNLNSQTTATKSNTPTREIPKQTPNPQITKPNTSLPRFNTFSRPNSIASAMSNNNQNNNNASNNNNKRKDPPVGTVKLTIKKKEKLNM